MALSGQVLSTERLTEALWGEDPPRSSGKVVQNLVLRLRKMLGPDAIATRSGGYELRTGPDAVDVRRFERLAAEGRTCVAKHDRAGVDALSAALALWRSSPLPEIADWPPARAEIARLEELHRCLIEDLAEAELDLGHHREWVAQLEVMVADEPLRERRWGLLMVALYRSGRQADSVAHVSTRTISIVDVVGERKLGTPLATEPLQSATFSPDGSVLASSSNGGPLSLLDAESGRLLHRLVPPGMRQVPRCSSPPPTFSPDGRLVAYGGLTGQVAIFDVASGDLVTTLVPPPATTDHPFIDPAIVPLYVGPLAFSPDGTELRVGGVRDGDDLRPPVQSTAGHDLRLGQTSDRHHVHAGQRPPRGLRISKRDTGLRSRHRRTGRTANR